MATAMAAPVLGIDCCGRSWALLESDYGFSLSDIYAAQRRRQDRSDWAIGERPALATTFGADWIARVHERDTAVIHPRARDGCWGEKITVLSAVAEQRLLCTKLPGAE